jgi:hypothetical protein
VVRRGWREAAGEGEVRHDTVLDGGGGMLGELFLPGVRPHSADSLSMFVPPSHDTTKLAGGGTSRQPNREGVKRTLGSCM